MTIYTSSTSESTDPDSTLIFPAEAGIAIVLLFGLLATVTVVALLLLVYYKRKRSALVNLTKPHKGSEENSYASSEHSHQQGSKYSESPEPGYDVIKPRHPLHEKDKIFPPKSTHSDMNPTHPSDIVDNQHYSEITSSYETTGSHNICSCEYSAPSAKDNPSINCDEKEQKTPQTIEMMYTAVQKQPKVNAGMDSEFEDSTPPQPPQTTEMMYTAVQKRSKDSILAEVEDDAPPVPPYMEKEDKETEATAKGSDEGSPPPVPPQTTEMLCIAV